MIFMRGKLMTKEEKIKMWWNLFDNDKLEYSRTYLLCDLKYLKTMLSGLNFKINSTIEGTEYAEHEDFAHILSLISLLRNNIRVMEKVVKDEYIAFTYIAREAYKDFLEIEKRVSELNTCIADIWDIYEKLRERIDNDGEYFVADVVISRIYHCMYTAMGSLYMINIRSKIRDIGEFQEAVEKNKKMAFNLDDIYGEDIIHNYVKTCEGRYTEEWKKFRKRNTMTECQLAKLFNISISTLRQWRYRKQCQIEFSRSRNKKVNFHCTSVETFVLTNKIGKKYKKFIFVDEDE